jgi:hypothetical protein
MGADVDGKFLKTMGQREESFITRSNSTKVHKIHSLEMGICPLPAGSLNSLIANSYIAMSVLSDDVEELSMAFDSDKEIDDDDVDEYYMIGHTHVASPNIPSCYAGLVLGSNNREEENNDKIPKNALEYTANCIVEGDIFSIIEYLGQIDDPKTQACARNLVTDFSTRLR